MADRWRRPRVFAIAAAIAGVAAFVLLGSWQLRRAHEKEALFAAYAHAEEQAPVTLAQARGEVDATRWPLVEVDGTFEPARAYVLDDQVRAGRAGIMLFGVFAPSAGGDALLVNRGFLPRGARGETPQPPPPPQGAQHLRALYAPPPGAGLRLGGNALPRQASWPKTTIYVDLGEIAADLGRRLDPRVLLQVSPDAEHRGFVRNWTPEVFPPERHYGYAFTWFTFAAVVAATFAILHRRRFGEPR
jgi:cytochrome oxidase assembly protein ShyY1